MDIKAIEEYVQASNIARNVGILSVYNNEVHVSGQLFDELLNEKGSLEIERRDCDTYSYQAKFVCNDLTYISLYTKEGLINKFGGNIDECITTK